MSDSVQSFMFEELDIRGAIIKLSASWKAIQADRAYPLAVRDVLGEMCAIATLLAANLKQPGRLGFQLSGPGSVSMLVIDCSDDLNLRGYARYDLQGQSEQGLRALLAGGMLGMTLDIASARDTFQSMVPVETDSVAEVFEHYLMQSEQQPAAIVLAANADTAAGIFLQKLPGADLKDEDGWNRVVQLLRTLRKEELLELDALEILTRLYHEETVRVFSPASVRHEFPPQPEKIHDVLRSLGRAELERILTEHGEIHVRDDLSNHDYYLNEAEAMALFADGKPTLH